VKRRGALAGVLAWMAALQGCGGGGGGFDVADIGSGGTGINPGGIGSGGTGATAVRVSSTGPIEGFGSIVVNGVRYDTESAQLQLADVTGLRLGMTVQVQGTLNPDGVTGTATLVVSAADLRGAASAVDARAGTLRVLGVDVHVDEHTVFGGGLGGLNHVRNGDPVQVHGLPGAGGMLLATRIERLAAADTPILVGTIDELDTVSQTFLLGTQRVRFAGAALTGSWNGRALAEGQTVRVRASTSAGGVLQAESIEPWALATTGAPDGGTLALAGLVSQFEGLGSFRVDGVLVDASAAQVSGGPARDVRSGARVEVTGAMRNGVLVAQRVRIRKGPASVAAQQSVYSAEGSVGAFRSAASFKVQGQDIDASSAVFVGGTAADLQSGRKVLVTGSRVLEDVLIASRVEFLA
jgi:hypothetical protein